MLEKAQRPPSASCFCATLLLFKKNFALQSFSFCKEELKGFMIQQQLYESLELSKLPEREANQAVRTVH